MTTENRARRADPHAATDRTSLRAIDAIVQYAAATRRIAPEDQHGVADIAGGEIPKWTPRLTSTKTLTRRREVPSEVALLFCILAPSLAFWGAISLALSGNGWACIAALVGLLVGAAAGWAARGLDGYGFPPQD